MAIQKDRLMVFNPSRPLRRVSVVGAIGSPSALLFAIYSIAVNLINGHVVEGGTTTMLFMSVLLYFSSSCWRFLVNTSADCWMIEASKRLILSYLRKTAR
ncbi:MAG: hypothetical protein E6265_04255 [Enterobacteriaceae bacterium]|nr:hypothetical protein [Enterobacteriaceae bacterium]